jgi:iron complex outermembrane receptor protein
LEIISNSKKLATSIALGLGLAVAPVASMQAAEGVLEEVIVTAQKRAQNIQDVPISITALSGETMDNFRAGGKDIRFLNGKAPSLVVESDFGRIFPRFYIRGIGNTDFDQNASQPVSLVYDDVVYENPMLKGFPIFDTERVEVLRGPQGTLFGRNTPAGIVKLDSVKPSQEFEAYAKISAGNLGVIDFEGAVGGALTDRWSARLSVLDQRRDDWVANRASDIDPSLAFLDDGDFLEGHRETAARFQVAYEGDNFDALFNLHTRNLDGTATLFRANIIEPGSNSLVSGFDEEVVNFDGKNEQTAESVGFTAKLVWDLGDYTLTSISGYETVKTFSRADVEGGIGAAFLPISGPGFIPFPAQTADGIPDHNQKTQELRINNNNGEKLHWQAGVFYFSEHLIVDSFDFADRSDNFVGFARQRQDTTAWAAFGQFDYDLSDELILTVGLRYSDDEKNYSALRSTDLFGVPALGPFPRTVVRTDDNEVSGNVSLNYTLNENVSVYGRIARGFRAPSIQGRVLFSNSVTVGDSETILSYETGIKSELFDNSLRLNATVYALTVSDQQLTAGSGVDNANVLINADKTNGYGVELDAEWAVNNNLFVTLGASYNNTEIDDSSLSVLPCGAGCTVKDPPGSFPGSVSIDGNTLPRAPEWISNVTVRYTHPMEKGEMYFQTDWSYRSDISFFLYSSEEFHGDSLLEGGINVGYVSADGKYELSVFGRNITDQIKLVAAIDFNNLEGIINDPRTYGVSFTTRF